MPVLRSAPEGSQSMTLSLRQNLLKNLGIAYKYLVQSRLGCLAITMLLVAFVLKPSVSTMIARTLVTVWRLILRRFLQIVSLIFDGMVDEIVYQFEYAAVDFLPPGTDVPKVAKASFNLAAHVLSGLIGASLAVLFGRRTPIQAWTPPIGLNIFSTTTPPLSFGGCGFGSLQMWCVLCKSLQPSNQSKSLQPDITNPMFEASFSMVGCANSHRHHSCPKCKKGASARRELVSHDGMSDMRLIGSIHSLHHPTTSSGFGSLQMWCVLCKSLQPSNQSKSLQPDITNPMFEASFSMVGCANSHRHHSCPKCKKGASARRELVSHIYIYISNSDDMSITSLWPFCDSLGD